MVMRTARSQARIERQLATTVAGQRMAGAEPDELAVEAARHVAAGEATAEEAIRDGLAAIKARFGRSE